MNVSNRGVLQYVLLKTVLQNKMAVRVNLSHWISHDKWSMIKINTFNGYDYFFGMNYIQEEAS